LSGARRLKDIRTSRIERLGRPPRHAGLGDRYRARRDAGRDEHAGVGCASWLLAVAGTAAALHAGSNDDTPAGARARASGDAVVAIDPETNRLVAAIPVGRTPSDVVVGGGAVWSLNAEARTLSRIDPGSRTMASFATGREPTGIAAGENAVWVGSGVDSSRNVDAGVATSQLARIGARSRAIELTAPVRRGHRASRGASRSRSALTPCG
jgi:YVTN family beta-propeller protein